MKKIAQNPFCTKVKVVITKIVSELADCIRFAIEINYLTRQELLHVSLQFLVSCCRGKEDQEVIPAKYTRIFHRFYIDNIDWKSKELR